MLTYESFTSYDIVYCAGCEVRLVRKQAYGRGNTISEWEYFCESCYKAALRADGTPLDRYDVRCAACGKSIHGSARVGPDGVICHRCYDKAPEGRLEIEAMREWWRDKAPDHRQAADESTPLVDFGARRRRRVAAESPA